MKPDRSTGPASALSYADAQSFSRHRGPITGVAGIPGQGAVLSSGYDGAVAHFDPDTREVKLLGYHRHLVNRICVDAEGARAASCSSDYSIGLWDLHTLRPTGLLLGHSDDVEDFVFVDADTGVSASRDRRILVWNLRTGAIRNILEGHDRDVLSLAFHQGRLYSSGDDRTLRTWDLATGRLLSTWGPFEDETDTCALDPRRGRAILGCDDGHVRVFDLATGRLIADLDAHQSGVKKVAVSPTTGDILSAAYDQRVLVWEAATLRNTLSVQRTRATWERSLVWSPDGSLILAGSFDGTVLVFDAATGALQAEVGSTEGLPGNACLNDVSAAPDGRVAVVSDDGFLRLGQLAAGRFGQTLEPAGGRLLMNAVALSPDGQLLAGGTHDGRLALYEDQAGTYVPLRCLPLQQGPINSIRFAPSGPPTAFVACYSGAISRVDPGAEAPQSFALHDGAVKALRLHPQRPMGVSCGADQQLLAWSLDGELIERFYGHSAIINDLDLSPDGDRLASVSRDFTLKLYDLARGKLIASHALGRRSLKSVCFWGDDLVLVGDYWGKILAVELSTGVVRSRTIARNGLSALGRHPDGLLAVSYEGCAILLDPESLEERGRLQAMHQRLDAAWDGVGICAPPLAPDRPVAWVAAGLPLEG